MVLPSAESLFDRVPVVKWDASGHRRIVLVPAVGPDGRRTMSLEARLAMSSAPSASTPATRLNRGQFCSRPGGDASCPPYTGGSR